MAPVATPGINLSLSVVLGLMSLAWSAGLFIGILTAKFVSKKDCSQKSTAIHERIDDVQHLLSGGKMIFELKQITPKNAPAPGG